MAKVSIKGLELIKKFEGYYENGNIELSGVEDSGTSACDVFEL